MRLKDALFPLGEEHFVPATTWSCGIRGFPAFSYVMDAVDAPDVLYPGT